MKFSIQREALLVPITQVVGVVERRQTLPVLGNFLLEVDDDGLKITGSDMEVEMVGQVSADVAQPGSVTVPARKLVDICKALPEGVRLDIQLNGEKLAVHAGRSRFTLATLPASEFPSSDSGSDADRLTVSEERLGWLLEKTSFAMANQDVRHYLNGLLMEFRSGMLRAVATDGHRLALAEIEADVQGDGRSLILPRKGVVELSRILSSEDEPVEIALGNNFVQVRRRGLTLTSKLIDGRFPDYEAVIPMSQDKGMTLARQDFIRALQRAAILSNEKYRGVRLKLSPDTLEIVANNPEQEQAEEVVPVDYAGDGVEIGFNVGYLLDVLGVLSGEAVRFSLSDPNSSALLEESEAGDSLYVVMPMRL